MFEIGAPISASPRITYCSREDPAEVPPKMFFVFFAVVSFIIIISSFLNIALHLGFKKLRSESDVIIIGICGAVIITFIFTLVTAVFQYLYKVNGNSGICAVFKYIITSFSIVYTLVKATYLFHFAYIMYRSYKLLPYRENSKNGLYIYIVFNVIVSTICTVLVIVIDLLHDRTVFAMHNGYCADFSVSLECHAKF